MFSLYGKAVKAFVLAGIVGGLAVGCESGVVAERSALSKGQNAVAKQTSVKQFTPEQMAEMVATNVHLESMSIAIAKTLTDESMRQWVYGKCMERFDGETNVLWQHLAADRSRSWVQKISTALPHNKEIFGVEIATAKVQTKMNANLHLFWYNAEKWDKQSSPIIVYTPVGKDPEKMPYLTGFDAQGRSYQVDEAFAKTHTVVVLTFNERTNLNGEILTNLHSINTKGNASLQSSNVTIVSIDLKHDANWYEGWFGGDPEFRAVSKEPGGSLTLGEQDFTMPRGSLPTIIHPSRPIVAASIAQYTQITWWELDETIGEWALFEDDFLGTHQVPLGSVNTTIGNADHGATYTWQ